MERYDAFLPSSTLGASPFPFLNSLVPLRFLLDSASKYTHITTYISL